jgi:hypothetical protein
LSALGSVCTILTIHFQTQLGFGFWYIIIGFISIVTILTFLDTSLVFYNETINTKPKILKVIERNKCKILLTEYSDYFQIQGLVTVFYLNEGFEELVGYGEVINIQNDKKIQIELKNVVISVNLSEVKDSLIVKPFVTTKTINND